MCKSAEPSQLESGFFFLWVIKASCVSTDAADVQSAFDLSFFFLKLQSLSQDLRLCWFVFLIAAEGFRLSGTLCFSNHTCTPRQNKRFC